jgi:hypothetical protein
MKPRGPAGQNSSDPCDKLPPSSGGPQLTGLADGARGRRSAERATLECGSLLPGPRAAAILLAYVTELPLFQPVRAAVNCSQPPAIRRIPSTSRFVRRETADGSHSNKWLASCYAAPEEGGGRQATAKGNGQAQKAARHKQQVRENEATLTQSVANVAAAEATDQTAGRWMQVPAVQVAPLTTQAILVESKATGGLFIAAAASQPHGRRIQRPSAEPLAHCASRCVGARPLRRAPPATAAQQLATLHVRQLYPIGPTLSPNHNKRRPPSATPTSFDAPPNRPLFGSHSSVASWLSFGC